MNNKIMSFIVLSGLVSTGYVYAEECPQFITEDQQDAFASELTEVYAGQTPIFIEESPGAGSSMYYSLSRVDNNAGKSWFITDKALSKLGGVLNYHMRKPTKITSLVLESSSIINDITTCTYKVTTVQKQSVSFNLDSQLPKGVRKN